MEQVLEIRSYQLQAGTAERFQQLMQEQSLPLLRAAGTDVLVARPSLHAPECYLLLRAYRSLAQREQSQDAFYASPAWLDGPREELMACIAHYTTVLIPADPALLTSLRHGAESPTIPSTRNNMQTKDQNHDGRHDFDFLLGRWQVSNQRLRRRLQDCTEWESFEATQHNQALPGGIGNYDDFIAASWRPGFTGMSLRLFNPGTRLWSIYWLDNLSGGLNEAGQLLPPVVGKFEHGIGVFEGEDELDGQAIRVRYTWSAITANSACWEQAMSNDGGLSWEMNWRMRLQRIA